MGASIEGRTFIPQGDIDTEFVEMCTRLAQKELTNGDTRPRLVFGNGEAVELPAEMVEILGSVAHAMLEGRAVTVMPTNTVLSTQEAADLLGVSRPTLVRLLEDGVIPFTKPRCHRRIQLTDLLEYRKRQQFRADEALADMMADAQSFEDYDVDPQILRDALKKARHGE